MDRYNYKTTDGILVMNQMGSILFANSSARKMLGFSEKTILGKCCFEVLEGRDLYGNRFCFQGCSVMTMAVRNESVKNFDMEVTTKTGKRVWFNVKTLLEPRLTGQGGPHIVHVFRRIPALRKGKDLFWETPSALNQITITPKLESVSALMKRFPQSQREAEVLGFLTQGLVAKEIGAKLKVSTETVRTHTQNILKKLQVHSKLEAVTLVLRQEKT